MFQGLLTFILPQERKISKNRSPYKAILGNYPPPVTHVSKINLRIHEMKHTYTRSSNSKNLNQTSQKELILPVETKQAISLMISPYSSLTIEEILERLSVINSEPAKETKPLMKTHEVAEMLGFTRVHVSRLADAGEITRVNIGTDINKPVFRISVESVNEFLKRRSVQKTNSRKRSTK